MRTANNRQQHKQLVFMNFAKLISTLSTCSRLQVGSVVTNENLSKVYAIGYNGNSRGFPNKCDSEELGNCGCIHSESNSLIKCGTNDQKKILFVTTLPCMRCAKLIINSGFKEIFYKEEYRDLTSLVYFKKAGITITKI